MAQADYIISNQTFPNTRADINNHLSAIATNNSGTSAPTTQYAGQFWIDTTTTTWTLYIHDGSDDIQFATIDTSANTVNFIDSALDVVTDTTPQLGGDLDLNSNDITGTGNINITGNATVTGNLSVDGGTIKLDGNYPTGTDNVALGDTALDSLTTGYNNVAIGSGSMTANTEGYDNTAIGRTSLTANTTGGLNTALGRFALGSNITGNSNTAVGRSALGSNNANNNTAVGYEALFNNTDGTPNTALGGIALQDNTTGNSNVAVGYGALADNTTASDNTALGREALRLNVTGSANTALGRSALYNNTASNNTAVGYQALQDNTSGTGNTALGLNSLNSNTTGNQNTGIGHGALLSNTASYNTAVGYQALYTNVTGEYNTAIGRTSLSLATGSLNTCVGYASGEAITTGSKNTIIGAYNGNQGGLDIRTSSNNIVLSDGDGNVRMYMISNGDIFFKNTTESAINGGTTDAKMIDNGDGGRLRSARSSTSAREHIIFYNPNGDVGDITTSGTSTSFNTSSDYRLKENVVEMTGATERLKQLSPKRFNFIADADTTVDGFLAHEVSDIVPEAITGTKDEVDADGNPVYQGIDQSKLVPLLVATIKELEARITALEGA